MAARLPVGHHSPIYHDCDSDSDKDDEDVKDDKDDDKTILRKLGDTGSLLTFGLFRRV